MIEKQSLSSPLQLERSTEFIRAFDILEDTTDNLFITGKAGTGKSTFLEYFRRNTQKKVVVLAPTGVSALNVKGQTIHSFFHFKPRLISADSIKPKRNRKIYQSIEILIIDEISMVRADVFDGVEKFLRLNGPKRGEPFGGVQVCVIGDLYQLPPIVSSFERNVFFQLYKSPFFFSSEAFDLAHFGVVELTKIYRQSETSFIEALNKIRTGDTSLSTIEFFNQRHQTPPQTHHGTTIVLTTTNKTADTLNSKRMQQLTSKEYCYDSTCNGNFSLTDEKLPAPKHLKLRVGAQVMFTKNHSGKKWVNGTIGTVEELSDKEITVGFYIDSRYKLVNVKRESWETVKYRFDETANTIVEEVAGEFHQYPLLPAWAITIHKSQGKTLDRVIIDIGYGTFAPGQLYVALSRCRSFDHIYLQKPICGQDVSCDTNVIEFTNSFIG